MSIKEVCKVKLDISQKKTQLPSLFRPVNPLTPVELKEAIVTIFDFILAHDKFRRKSKLRKNRWKKTYRSESSTRDSGKQRKEPLINDYFDSPMIARILGHVCYIFKNEPTLLNINFPLNPMAKNRNDPTTTPTTSHELIVCGDIHGSISELMAIFEQHGMPPVTNFLFLGDYVDRGKCSLSVILFLFLMKIRWPKHLYMLRGNHEAFVISSEYGFRKECKKHFPDESIFGLLNVVFAYMPLAAIIHNCAFCCHGGVSQWIKSRAAIASIPRPLLFERLSLHEHLIATDLMWADPKRLQENAFSPSFTRGCGFNFNKDGLQQVLQKLRCTFLIRAHEAKRNGVEEMFGGLCMTVHSTELPSMGKAAVLRLTINNRYTHITIESFFHCKKDVSELARTTSCCSKYQKIYRHFPSKKVISPFLDLRPIFRKLEDERFFRQNVAGQDELHLWVKSNVGPLFDEYVAKKNICRPKVAALRLFPSLLAVAFEEKPYIDKDFSREATDLLLKFSKYCAQLRIKRFERLEITDDERINTAARTTQNYRK